METQFQYVNRNYPNTIVLIPGWATDCGIFGDLDLKFNYIETLKFHPADFKEKLLEALKKHNIKKVSLFGFSMGGFLATEFARDNQELIDDIFLIAIREKYRTDEITKVRGYLKQSKDAYLSRFYSFSFSKKEEIAHFKKELLKKYLRKFDTGYLFELLDCLENMYMMPEALENIERIKIIHGELDTIAPITEAISIKNKLPQADFVEIKGSGHIPFFKKDFNQYI